jgi:piezo-type mechanosensitive ion channel component 1/2
MQRNLSNLFYKNVYIFANGSMMIWSILYHSWLSFLLLIWANLIWIRKDQRKHMMNSSPYLMVYALFLLVINYIYGMKFTDDEIPTQFNDLNMQQIGLVKYENYPGIPLLIKSIFTVFFMITTRLMIQENLLNKHKTVLSFEENVRKAMEEKNKPKKHGVLAKALMSIEKICVFCFMWIIILTLFIMAVSGDKMTLFKIINMCFCLAFFLLFHISFKLWLRTMYVFWTALILYAICALILVYAYQFDDFPVFPFQAEIGLQKYETAKLFVKLLSFTLVNFLTGLQMNKFHHQFLEHFDRKQNLLRANIEESSTDEQQKVCDCLRRKFCE